MKRTSQTHCIYLSLRPRPQGGPRLGQSRTTKGQDWEKKCGRKNSKSFSEQFCERIDEKYNQVGRSKSFFRPIFFSGKYQKIQKHDPRSPTQTIGKNSKTYGKMILSSSEQFCERIDEKPHQVGRSKSFFRPIFLS